jgi:pimeloyl-ACP methyl ester carboxylesterase
MTIRVALRLAAGALLALAGCATPRWFDRDASDLDSAALPAPNVTLNIPGLGPCTDNPDRSLHLDSRQPVAVLVHGCYGSSGLFRSLAQVLAFHGQQSACFTYDDRDSMMVSSRQLIAALDQLGAKMDDKALTVIGHSQGALIARKALVADRPDAIANRDLRLRLVTVSGPFSGIASANQCGDPVTRKYTLGLIAPLCRLATGDKWSEITYTSDFILKPGALHPQVLGHLKVVTDERGSCRRAEGGRCLESDDVFSLREQRQAIVDSAPRAKVEEVKAGHVEIIGDKDAAPVKLIAVLQRNEILHATPPHRADAFGLLLSRLYGLAEPRP